MEIGAVKQAFNNELILLKKNLNQARIQIIHKLTRKAKQLTEKKAPDALKEKNKRKAESAVREVLIIKKIKPRDIGKFIVTHKGKLLEHLNKPEVDNDKACARLLLHKAMQEKYNLIRNRFSDIPIKDLFMSRQERRKLKKEEMQKKKEKRDKKKAKGNLVNAEGDWDVEEVKKGDDNAAVGGDDDVDITDDDKAPSGDENAQEPSDDEYEHAASEDENEPSEQSEPESDAGSEHNVSGDESDDDDDNEGDGDKVVSQDEEENDEEVADFEQFVKAPPAKKVKKAEEPSVKKPVIKSVEIKPRPDTINKNKPDKKDTSKNKNLKQKIFNKKFKKDLDETPNLERKVVDPFFITSNGENYMSVAEPRQPDEFKEEHRQGNRKLRRAVMFGHVPKIKPRQDFKQDNKFDRQNGFMKRCNFNDRAEKNDKNGFPKHNRFNDNKFEDKRKPLFNDRKERSNQEDSKPEKLHPSWEAKKKQSGILPFKGKKIVFDDS
ncbi:serum response factor-binding protein 1-like [Pectinophora gossypiella]|uniref:serum response factor-binding protein 1-like n=1 Tax=Pectinophora gossypiella TaxID=13191 RepID=UPI00214EED4C|nr:serum response factor-binding protein 1-like [Pectinophora gossypiella]